MDIGVYIESISDKDIYIESVLGESRYVLKDKKHKERILNTFIKNINKSGFTKQHIVLGKVMKIRIPQCVKNVNYCEIELADSDGDENMICVRGESYMSRELFGNANKGDFIIFVGLECNVMRQRIINNLSSRSRHYYFLTAKTTSFYKFIRSNKISSLIVPSLSKISDIKLGNECIISCIGYVIGVDVIDYTSKGEMFRLIEIIDFSNVRIMVKLNKNVVSKYKEQELMYSSILISYCDVEKLPQGKILTIHDDFEILDFNTIQYNGKNTMILRAIEYEKTRGSVTKTFNNLDLYVKENLTKWKNVEEISLRKLIIEIEKHNKNQTKLDNAYFKCRACIRGYVNINSESEEWYYTKHEINHEIKRIWRLKCFWYSKDEISFFKSDMYTTVFDDGCKTIFGISADDAFRLKKEDICKYQNLLTKKENKMYLLCIYLKRNKDKHRYEYHPIVQKVFNVNSFDIEDWDN